MISNLPDFYSLTTHVGSGHFEKWERDGKKSVWVLLRDFVYGQIVKHDLGEKQWWVLSGEEGQCQERLRQAGLNEHIKTSFVERLNLRFPRRFVNMVLRSSYYPHTLY